MGFGFELRDRIPVDGSSEVFFFLAAANIRALIEFRPMLAGWYIDIPIGYLIRAVIRLVKLRRSEGWALEDAVVSSSTCPLALYGGPVAEIGYTYNHAGSYYVDVHSEPFILRSSAEEYAATFAVGAHITIWIDPNRPEISVFREDDQTRMRVRLQQIAVDQPRP